MLSIFGGVTSALGGVGILSGAVTTIGGVYSGTLGGDFVVVVSDGGEGILTVVVVIVVVVLGFDVVLLVVDGVVGGVVEVVVEVVVLDEVGGFVVVVVVVVELFLVVVFVGGLVVSGSFGGVFSVLGGVIPGAFVVEVVSGFVGFLGIHATSVFCSKYSQFGGGIKYSQVTHF